MDNSAASSQLTAPFDDDKDLAIIDSEVNTSEEAISEEAQSSWVSSTEEDVWYINKREIRRCIERECDYCRKCTQAFHYQCLECLSFPICASCLRRAQHLHQGHRFRKIDLAFVLKECQWKYFNKETRLPTDKPSDIIPVPRDCCPTCFDHHPAKFTCLNDDGQCDGDDCHSWMSSHNLHMTDLQVAAAKGCEICSLAYRGLSTADPSLVTGNVRLQWRMRRSFFCFSTLGNENLADHWQWYFYAHPERSCRWQPLQKAKLLPNNFAKLECFENIRSQIKLCETEHLHAKCMKRSATTLPRRVVALNRSDLSSIRIYETLGETDKYIALSHCWGASPTMTTTSQDIERMRDGFPSKDLPATFRDAIRCACMLDVQYVWIDALCIIQDDQADWEAESATMCDVYSNAYLVVVAASAEGDHAGFLKERSRIFHGIPLESKEGSRVYDIWMQHSMPHAPISMERRHLLAMIDGRTENRAWCLQETALARRTVYFHQSEILWECSTCTDCECGRAAAQIQNIDATSNFCLGPTLTFSHSKRVGRSYAKPFVDFKTSKATYDEWMYSLIPTYTRRQLSRNTDRLPALSGIAALVAKQCSDEYLAGIWRGDLQMGLLWSIDRDSEPKISPHPILAPSFSWASVDQVISYDIPLRTWRYDNRVKGIYGAITLQLLEAQSSMDYANPYGNIHGGYIRVSGLAQHMSLKSEAGHATITCDHSHRHLRFKQDTVLCQISSRNERGLDFISVNRASMETENVKSFSALVDCLIVANIPYDPDNPLTQQGKCVDEYIMLVLGRSVSPPEAYERLGILFLAFDPGISLNWVAEARRQEYLIM